MAGVELDHVGYAIVVVFVVTWRAAFTIWPAGRIEERWPGDARRPVHERR